MIAALAGRVDSAGSDHIRNTSRLYCASRWLNAVSCGPTRLTAPPRCSIAMAVKNPGTSPAKKSTIASIASSLNVLMKPDFQ